jgi:hypothetical protein
MTRTPVLIALVALAAPPAAPAQPAAERPPTTITLRPAPAPVPALKYRLVPERRSLAPGNAAVFYHRGIQMLMETRARLTGQAKGDAARPGSPDVMIAEWVAGPIDKIPRDEARARLASFDNALKEVELGAARASCDWELDRRTEGIYLLMPEIQETRSLARLVALRAKLAVLDGKVDEAMHWVETGLVLGRHVSQGPTVIQALVGVAIDFVMLRCLEDLIQAPGAPSLYWALADRPRPFVDLRAALEGERYLLEKELPEVGALDRGPWSLDEARRFADDLQRKLLNVASGDAGGAGGPDPRSLAGFGRRLTVAVIAAKVYPEAKRALIARGRTAAEVEAMPVVQAAALYSLLEYQRVRDDSYKWMNLPYWQSYGRADQSAAMSVEEKLANPLLTLFRFLTPSLNAVRLAALRLERQLDALECVEAVRLHAAAHGSSLPRGLDAITDAPAPLDPATGKPFSYAADGEGATLTAPAPPGAPARAGYNIDYVLRLAR